ncbi:MAG: polyprenyl synthetase family protein [Anaerolineae bacterium]
MTLREALDRYLPPLEQLQRTILAPTSDDFKPHYGMQQYHQGWLNEHLQPVAASSGKRVRAVLCLLCCEACGAGFERALPLAAAIELLHSFSLVHDDIQDKSQTRRHRPTVWALWGAAQAINVGDSLYAAAHAALYRLQTTLPADAVLRLAVGFEDTCLRLCEGQYLDMAFEQETRVSHSRYMSMIERKTAVLIAYSAQSGAIAAGTSESAADVYRQMGRELGLAFQIQDDILGIWGDEEETGKSASSDIASAKKTLPLIYALEALPETQAAELEGIYARPSRDEAAIVRARELIDASGAKRRCLMLAQVHHAAALQHLQEAHPLPEAEAALRELIGQLSGRQS